MGWGGGRQPKHELAGPPDSGKGGPAAPEGPRLQTKLGAMLAYKPRRAYNYDDSTSPDRILSLATLVAALLSGFEIVKDLWAQCTSRPQRFKRFCCQSALRIRVCWANLPVGQSCDPSFKVTLHSGMALDDDAPAPMPSPNEILQGARGTQGKHLEPLHGRPWRMPCAGWPP